MKKYFGYVRVSTVKQGDGVSLESQREAIIAFAEQHNITITNWFEEKVTAAKRGRPLFNKMVSSLKRGQASGVIFYKIDRSTRNFADWAKIGDLAEDGIEVHFATETLDFNSRGGRLSADMQVVMATDYIRGLRADSIRGQHGRLKQGIYPFKAPLGYLDAGKGKPKTVDPVRGPLIRVLFELYATGNYSLWSIVPEIEKRGLTSSNGKALPKTSIEKILRNPFYAGVMKVRTSNQSYLGIHDPLISVDLYRRVEDVRFNRNNKKSTKHNHRYRGLITCGGCGRSLVPEKQKGHVYYRCHKPLCPTKTIREDIIEAKMKAFLSSISLGGDQLDTLKQHAHQWIQDADKERLAIQADLEVTKVSERISRLTDKFVDDLIDVETYNAKKADLLLQQQKWQALKKQKVTDAQKLARLEKLLERLKNAYSAYCIGSTERKREIMLFASSNRKYFEEKLMIEPSNTVSRLLELANMSYCDPCSANYRTPERSEELEQLWRSNNSL